MNPKFESVRRLRGLLLQGSEREKILTIVATVVYELTDAQQRSIKKERRRKEGEREKEAASLDCSLQ